MAISSDSTPIPTTPAELPEHRATPLTEAERAALPPLVWERYTEHAHYRSQETEEGSWWIKPCRGDEPAPLSFQLPRDPGETLADLFSVRSPPDFTIDQLGWWRRMARKSPQEMGYAITQDAARWVADELRRVDPTENVEERLTAAGFEFQHRVESNGQGPLDVFHWEDRRGLFCLHRGPHSVHLTREKRGGGTSWTNLLRLTDSTVLQDGRCVPVYWPATVADPMRAALCVAIQLSQTWTPAPSSRRHKP